MKTTKPLIEMTPAELREEIANLNLLVSRLTVKNKNRKRALKDVNRSVLTNFHHTEKLEAKAQHWLQQHNAITKMYAYQKEQTATLQKRLNEFQFSRVPGHFVTDRKPSFLQRWLSKGVTRASRS